MNGSFGAVNGDCVGLEQAENRSPCFVWTARALERCSFSVAENDDAAELSVEVSRKDGRGSLAAGRQWAKAELFFSD